MRIGFVFVFFCVVLSVSFAQDEDCECTVYYLCETQNTVESSSKCSGPEVCCRPSGPTSPNIVTAPTPRTTPRPGRPKDVPTTEAPNEDNDSNCECVPVENCPEVSGANQLDIRFGCNKGGEVCCPKRGGGGGDQNPSTPNPATNQGGGNQGGGNQGGGNQGGLDEFTECGVRRSSGLNNRITGGSSDKTDTVFGEYPWMMAILTSRTNKDGSVTENVFQCGATLILPTVVMTAAHCVNSIPVQDIKVRGGEWDTVSNNKSDREPFPYQERTVSQIYIHQSFEPSTVYNDIALIVLDFPFPVKDHIAQICTPNSVEEYDDQKCLVTGWGKDKFGVEGRYQSTLKKLDLKIVPRNICQQKLRQTRLGGQFKLHDSFICATGGPNQDACKGDGGGPLICQLKGQRDRYTQVGIVAWGIGCGTDTPGVYVDVRKFKKWILDNSHGQIIVTRIKTRDCIALIPRTEYQ
uniref:Phenoloxidase-activating factor 2 n=1 Tax=Cacopsylla melanoneura TaxID=428564 RepID=A0A8D8TJC9_9HEMI